MDHAVDPGDFNSYGSRRGNHEVMIRGTFANVRLRNQLAPGTEGGVSVHLPSGEEGSMYEVASRYERDGVPLVILAGTEYGSGSSRDWAAKGTALLGVKAVLAESYERIHRSNLIGMGVLPLQFAAGDSVASLGLTGEETFDIVGLEGLAAGAPLPSTLRVTDRRRTVLRCRPAHRHAERSRLLLPRWHPPLRVASTPRRLTTRFGQAQSAIALWRCPKRVGASSHYSRSLGGVAEWLRQGPAKPCT